MTCSDKCMTEHEINNISETTSCTGYTPPSTCSQPPFLAKQPPCFTFSDMAGELDHCNKWGLTITIMRPREEEALARMPYLDRSDIRIGNNWRSARHKTLERCGLRPSRAETGPDIGVCALLSPTGAQIRARTFSTQLTAARVSRSRRTPNTHHERFLSDKTEKKIVIYSKSNF